MSVHDQWNMSITLKHMSFVRIMAVYGQNFLFNGLKASIDTVLQAIQAPEIVAKTRQLQMFVPTILGYRFGD